MLSTTAMIWSQEDARLQLSIADQVRVIVSVFPHPGTEESLDSMNGAGSQSSVPVAEPLAATLVSAGHSGVVSAGQTMPGAIVSVIVTPVLHVSPSPAASVTVKSTWHSIEQPGDVSTVRVGIALLASSNSASEQSKLDQANVKASPGSGSLDPPPSS